MKDFLKAIVHALALLVYRRDETMAIIALEPMGLIGLTDIAEMRHQVDSNHTRPAKRSSIPT
jgi:hypothetical protein